MFGLSCFSPHLRGPQECEVALRDDLLTLDIVAQALRDHVLQASERAPIAALSRPSRELWRERAQVAIDAYRRAQITLEDE